MPFTFSALPIKGLVLVEPRVFRDPRGFFMESYKRSEFAAAGINELFVQDNHSFSMKNVIRCLHFQLPPKPQGKLVRVTRGTVWDVAVDLRKDSPTYMKWIGLELSDTNGLMLYIPAGFAHGFAALSDEVHLQYKCTEEYDAKLDSGVRWDDPDIGVKWPVASPVVSEKDGALPFLKDL